MGQRRADDETRQQSGSPILQALKLQPNSVKILYRLGIQLDTLGQATQAEAVFKAALQLAPNNTQLLARYRSLKSTPRPDPDFQASLGHCCSSLDPNANHNCRAPVRVLVFCTGVPAKSCAWRPAWTGKLGQCSGNSGSASRCQPTSNKARWSDLVPAAFISKREEAC